MDRYYTTKKLFGGKKAELWRQFISENFVELDCNGMSRTNFFGELRARSVGDLGISTITTDAYDVFRTDSAISKSATDDFIVSVQIAGISTIQQLGREVTLFPGDFTIYDSTMPYHLHFASRLSQLVVKVPRENLKKHLDSPETLTALHIRGGEGIAQITTDFAKNLFEQTENLDIQTQQQVADTFISLLTTSIREATNRNGRAPRNRATQLLRVKQFITQHLTHPELSLSMIAQINRIWPRFTMFQQSVIPSRNMFLT